MNDAEEGVFLKKFIEKKRTDYSKALNDSDSQKLFDKVADHYVKLEETLREMNSVPYIMSFTECRDSMQFWRQDYAKDKGICLRLNTTKFKFPTKLDGTPYEKECPTFRQVTQYEESIKMWLDDRGYKDIEVHRGDGVLNGLASIANMKALQEMGLISRSGSEKKVPGL